MSLIYLDNNASTAPDPAVVDAVAAAMSDLPANPASQHLPGRDAAAAIEEARSAVAACLRSQPQDVVFTAGATEANNLALIGVWESSRSSGFARTRIVVGATEHPSVMEAVRALAKRGAEVVFARVHRTGEIDLDFLSSVVNVNTLLVSVMLANNETGVIAPIEAVVDVAHRCDALVHCDATQAIGRIPVSFQDARVDLLSFSGHKMHGPKGVGVLLCRRHVPIEPMLLGGGQERGLRAGTLNTPGIVGLGVAALLAKDRLLEGGQVALLRDQLVQRLKGRLGGIEENGWGAPRLPNTANLRFVGADAEAVMAGMPNLACSSGSACSSAVPSPSPVLLAMGLTDEAASECLRFSLSRHTTREEIALAVEMVTESVEYVRKAVGVRST